MRHEIDELAAAWDVDMAEVVRQALRLGLPEMDAVPEVSQTAEAAQWWATLDRRTRSAWARKLRHIDGLDAVKAEAYRLSGQGEGA